MDSLLIRVLLFIAIFEGISVLLIIAHYIFFNRSEMYIDIRRFRKNCSNEYE
jgi:hypothetical protein